MCDRRRVHDLIVVLREHSAFLADHVVCEHVTPTCCACLAREVAPTAPDRIAIELVMLRDCARECDARGISAAVLVEELYAAAHHNLAAGIRIQVDDDSCARIVRTAGHAASALVLPDLLEQTADHLGATDLVVACHDLDSLLAAPWGSRAADALAGATRERPPTSELCPRLLRWDRGELTETYVWAEPGAPRFLR
jgi:hypothetical protein